MDERVSAAAEERARRMAAASVRALINADPLASAAWTGRRGAWASRAGAAGLGCALAIAPTETALTAALSLSALFLAAVAVRIAACLTPLARPASGEASAPRLLPRISLLCPLYQEAAQVSGLMEALAWLDYPASRLEILLVVEADDPPTVRAARAAARSRPGVRVIEVPPCEPRTKPKAMTYALRFAEGALIAVYDAEDAPARGQLRAAAEAFAADPSLACVQAPLGWYNAEENLLTRQFALEYAAQFHVLLPALARWGWALPLGGTSNVFSARALRESGGWDPYNVTEDADLGYRLARLGWRVGVIAPPTLEEAPVTLQAWLAQRSRWLKGHLITLRVHARRPFALASGGGAGALASLVLLLGANVPSAGVHPLAAAATIALSAYGLASGGLAMWFAAAAAGALASGYLAAGLSAFIGARRAGVRLRALDFAVVPVYWLMHALAALRALSELGRRRFRWAKTHHGLSAQPRRAPDDLHPDPALEPFDDDHRDEPRPRRAGVRGVASWPPGRSPEGPAPDPLDVDHADRSHRARGAGSPSLEHVRDRDGA